ncbi:MAG: hypothetical protein KDB18_12390, partial [Salinibacterium sp.]|nr:hypothetical protein [Salinibacterium sp.]
MKYIIVAIFLVLLGLVAYRQFRGTTDQSVVIDPDEASFPSEVEEMDGELPSTPSPTEPGRVDSGDPLRDSVHEIVISLLVEDPDPAAIDANYQRLAAVFADAGTPVGATVEFAIRDTLTMMELEVAKARPRNGVRLPLDANQTAFVASQALRYTQDIRRRALPKSGNQDHEGSMLASKPIVEMDIRGGYVGLSWKKIGDFTYKEGMELPDRVVALRDKKIAMTGYMMAMGQHEHIRE